MAISWLGRNLRSQFKYFLHLVLVIFLTHSCGVPSKSAFFTPSEKERYEEFFQKFLFLEQAVYTLYGSKPMTEIILRSESPDEKVAAQERAFKRLSKEDLAKLRVSSGEYEENYWFEETWSMWEKKLETLPIKRYLFVERKVGIPPEWRKNRYIYFINIPETAKVLQKHYILFREYVGFDFDPLSVVFDAENRDSPFWNAIWGREVTDKSVCLTGILFGYGLENSYPFSWHFTQAKSSAEAALIESVSNLKIPTVSVERLKQFNPPNSFLLPAYVSFSEVDSQKEQYKHEYEMIRRIYMHSDMLECTMRQLLK